MACKASVIVPVYNAEKTLRRCVESVVLGQERNIEVILVDDCSKDHSLELCLELAQEFPNVTAVQNEQNSGVSFTRNRGLELAQGDYVLFVDSDDWVSGRYVRTLLQLAEDYPSSLPICGQHFIDKVHHTKRDYRWDENTGTITSIPNSRFFELSDKFLLQQLWNKVFHRDVIKSNHIHFDETQSMGEDFQFVLDYMEAAQIRECVTISEPLYYYIRWNENSLMSKFGSETRDKAGVRFEKLYHLCGETEEAIADYQNTMENLQSNYIYHTIHSDKLTPKEKINTIRTLVGPERARAVYWQQMTLILKEQAVMKMSGLRRLPDRVSGNFSRTKREKKIDQLRTQLRNRDFTIISQNCIGGVFYHDMQLPFSSPTINLFIKEPDFVRFVLNLQHYIDSKLIMRWDEEYPVGVLDDIEIHFMHYDTCREAKEAWERRAHRINLKKILVLATDRNGFDQATFELWKQISYPKVLFTAQAEFGTDRNSVYFPQYEAQGFVPDLIPQRGFYKDGVLMNAVNSIREDV